MPYICLKVSQFPQNSSKSSGERTSDGNPTVGHPVTTNVWLFVMISQMLFFPLTGTIKQTEIKILAFISRDKCITEIKNSVTEKDICIIFFHNEHHYREEFNVTSEI